MALRHPALPTLWLMTDERQGDALWSALARLPRGGGVVLRHHATLPPERARMAARVARIARRRGLSLWREMRDRDGTATALLEIAPGRRSVARVRDMRALVRVRRADAVCVSPVFATRTHPGQTALGPLRAAAIARAARLPAIALGGMTVRRFSRMKPLGFVGWAAIDELTPSLRGQKRKAVPT